MNRWLLVLPLTLGAIPSLVRADSIWDRRDPRYAYLFQDNRARNIGDVLTVVISETTTANEQEQRALNKGNNANGTVTYAGNTSASNSAGGGGGAGGVGRQGALNFSLTDSFQRGFTGNAQLTTGRTFTDKMAVTVVDMMPNGNLVVEGYRSRVVAGEERVLRITGVIRQQDVGLGNVVQSQSVANFRVSYLGRGPVTRTINQNYFGRAMNRLWPW